MIPLTSTQETVLKAAVAREEGSIHPLPTNLKGGAANKVIASLKVKGLINDDDTINEAGRKRTAECGKYSGNFPSMNAAIQFDLAMTVEAPAALALETDKLKVPAALALESDESEAKLYADAEAVFMALTIACATPSSLETNTFEADITTVEQALAEAKPNRTGTKKAKVIELMQRPEGATAAQIAEATGWQGHTIRGFIAIAKKKMGLEITTNRLRVVGPNQQGSPGSFTTYFIA